MEVKISFFFFTNSINFLFRENVRLRVLELLKRWFELFGGEINEELKSTWQLFSTQISESNKRLQTLAQSIHSTTEKQIQSLPSENCKKKKF